MQIFKDFGITGKDEMLKFIKHPETFELNNDLKEFLLYLHDMLFSPDEDNSIKGAGVLIYAHLCICLACPDDFLFFSFYLRDLWKKRKKGDENPVIVIDEADALEFNKRVLNQHNEPEEKPAEQDKQESIYMGERSGNFFQNFQEEGLFYKEQNAVVKSPQNVVP